MQLLLFAWPQLRSSDLLGLKRQHVEQPLLLGHVVHQLLQPGSDLSPGGVQLPHFGKRRGVALAAEGIQEVHVPGRVHERLMLMLPVNIHQVCGQLLQRVKRHHHVLDAADVPTLPTQFTSDGDQTVLRLDVLLLYECKSLGVIGNVKKRLHGCFIRAGTDQVPIGASTQRQVDAVHHDGLACAGFACKYIESLHKFHAQ